MHGTPSDKQNRCFMKNIRYSQVIVINKVNFIFKGVL